MPISASSAACRSPRETREWDEGTKAFHAGFARKDCPYRLVGLSQAALTELGRKRADWLNGYNQAHEQDQAA